MATGSVMRPSNFRHDMRGAQVVEIRREEYERTKRSILKKIRRRLVILGVIIGLLSVISFILAGVVRGYHAKVANFQKALGGVSLRDLYFIYATASLVFSFHGLYVDGKWRKMQLDGNRLILHVRFFFALGVGLWAVALWLGIATLSAFGLLEVQYIASSGPNLIYLTTLIVVAVHLLVSPWLLRTIHRKGSQADEFFGAEFIADKRPRPQNTRPEYGNSDDDSSSDENVMNSRATAVVPAPSPPRMGKPTAHRKNRREDATPNRNRKAFFDEDGNATTSRLQLAMEGNSPRSARRQKGSRASSPRISVPASHPVVASSSSMESDSFLHQIPFASPVFMLDPQRNLAAPDFWQLWKQAETTGAFSCIFTNNPTKADLERHLATHGFHCVAVEQKDNVLQAYFYGSQYGTDTFFLCEFVLLFARRFFQATFKCKEREAASDFVTRFNLQELLTVEGEGGNAGEKGKH